jgi:hypothetical protein
MARIEIEGKGTFSVPQQVYDMVLEIIARAEAAERDRDNAISLMEASQRTGVLAVAIKENIRLEDEVKRLSQLTASLQNQGTECIICGRKNTLEIITLCSYCYEDHIA